MAKWTLPWFSSWRLMMILRTMLCFIQENAWNLSKLLLIIIALGYSLHPARFASHYTAIQPHDIEVELERAYAPMVNACLPRVTGLHQQGSQLLYPIEEPEEEPNAFARRLNILPGGQWRPSHCQPLFSVAIILPYRNRLKQLNIFINYIHLFLQNQNLEYRIFVIEQSPDKPFNRGKLFNVGFTEAKNIGDYHCFIFQDVDLIPQNPDNIYACTRKPRHMSSSVNTFRYNLPYTGLFGGAIAITRHQFQIVNGFSNIFFGWGGEDDDFYNRLQSKGLSVVRFSPQVSQYYMLKHKKEVPSNSRFVNLNSGSKRFDTDGISNLNYNVINHQLRPLYSWILVNI